MIRQHSTVREVFFSSMAGLVVGYMPWFYLAGLMQGQGPESVGVMGVISAMVVGNLFPLNTFRQRMEQFSDGKVATILFTLFIAMWLPIALFILFMLPEAPTTNLLGFGMVVMARVLLIIAPPPIGVALITLGRSRFGLKRSGYEG